MAPTGLSSKGKAIKPGSKPSQTPRSRNTTPLPNVRASVEPSSASSHYGGRLSSYLKKCPVTVEEILDSGANGSQIPSGKQLLTMRDNIEKTVLKNVESRCVQSEGALRELMSLKKNRAPRDREKDRTGDDRDRKHKLKKVNTKHDEDGKHPPAVGAHGVARQDGGDAKGRSAAYALLLCLLSFTSFFVLHARNHTLPQFIPHMPCACIFPCIYTRTPT